MFKQQSYRKYRCYMTIGLGSKITSMAFYGFALQSRTYFAVGYLTDPDFSSQTCVIN